MVLLNRFVLRSSNLAGLGEGIGLLTLHEYRQIGKKLQAAWNEQHFSQHLCTFDHLQRSGLIGACFGSI